jgi:hypothetical protein
LSSAFPNEILRAGVLDLFGVLGVEAPSFGLGGGDLASVDDATVVGDVDREEAVVELPVVRDD